MKRTVMALFGVVVLPWAAMAEPLSKGVELFKLQKVWDANLSFAKGQWEAIEPKGGDGGMFGRPGGGGPRGGGPRGGPGGPGGGGGFNPTRFMAGGWMQALDLDKDSKVSQKEFRDAFQLWAKEWDTTGVGDLGVDALRDGMNKSFAGGMPGAGGPGGGGGFAPRLQGAEGKRNGLRCGWHRFRARAG